MTISWLISYFHLQTCVCVTFIDGQLRSHMFAQRSRLKMLNGVSWDLTPYWCEDAYVGGVSETTHWHFGSCLQAIVANQTADDQNRKWMNHLMAFNSRRLEERNHQQILMTLVSLGWIYWPVYTFTTRRLASLNVKSRTDFWHKRFDPGGNRSLCQANWICAKIGCPKIGWLNTHIQPSTYNWYTTVLIRLLWSMAFRNPLTMPFHSIVSMFQAIFAFAKVS